jgi:hypothetical protein
MPDWKSVLKADPTSWLLEDVNPSVRYFALVDILGKPENGGEALEMKKKIMEHEIVRKILAKQKTRGNWGAPEDFYVRSKYRGTVWNFIILAEFGADGKDKRIEKACEFILENSQDPESGGFSYRRASEGGGSHGGVSPCLTGNMVWCLIRFDHLNDLRVQRGIDWIVKYQRFDDGINVGPKGWPYEGKEDCWGRHCCHMGVVKALKALAEIPVDKRSENVNATIKRGAEYMLKHHVYKRSHDLSRVAKSDWLRFGFPLMWNTDALEILGILTRLGYRDERMQEAVDLVVSKQDDEGRWKLENTFNGRFLVNIEQKGKPSKWITLNALKVLRRFYS